MFSDVIVNKVLTHAADVAPNECCGLIIIKDGTQHYIECRNISNHQGQFIIDPDDYIDIEDNYEIIGVAHSHYGSGPEPSDADLVGCFKSNLPWLIVSTTLNTHKIIYPQEHTIPLKGREFVHGIFDCYSIIKDYYKQELNIDIPDFKRLPNWWELGYNLYTDNFEKAGFIEVPFECLSKHDVILMQCRANTPNHAGIYLGNNIILQHLNNRLSGSDVYGGYWLRNTVKVLRHKDLV